ncbi:MAG: 16S rRNA (cytosine(1402)-N(4))-methyltransferase RsmH [Ruminococcus sp.]|nr:16S rRNA (cytosine(1402)-N(4))-methyltransferase RsmH [Ruminococcus sp.]
MPEYTHIPIMVDEIIKGLNIKPNGVYIDGTCGGAGHSRAIAEKLSEKGFLLAIDRDPDALAVSSERLAPYPAVTAKGNFSDMKEIAALYDIEAADGILLDLGVSSYQLDNPERGFSYKTDNPLDMRMGKEGISAFDVINSYSEEDLTRILYDYGDERFAPRIVSRIVAFRDETPIETTYQLAEIIKDAYPAKFRRDKNPCKKTFQAIRIEVNDEIRSLEAGLDTAFGLLKPSGRLAVITFHSLEDRIVKNRFRSYAKGCTCPPDFPVCVCGKVAQGRVVMKKTPSEKEIKNNNRARSAKLRIIEKVG